MSTTASDSNLLDQTAGVTTGFARHVRTLDDRLTLLAMRMTYIALTFFVVCFYFALTYLQIVNEHGLWKPSSLHQPNLALGISETALVLVGGLVYFGAQWLGLYRRNFARLQIGLWVAALLGFISIILHIAELHTPGFGLQDGGYASVFIGTEGVFTVLLIIAVLVLVGLANRTRLGLFRQSGIAIEAFGEFWGWVAAVALLNFLALYVQPFFPSA